MAVKRAQKSVYLPKEVKLISIFYYIGAVLALIMGLFLSLGLFLSSSFVDSATSSVIPLIVFLFSVFSIITLHILSILWIPELLFLPFGNFNEPLVILIFTLRFPVFVFLIIFVLGVLGFFVGRGLWNLRNWARIVAIIFAVIGILSGMISIFIQNGSGLSLTIIAVNGFIGWCLLFNKRIKEKFS